VASTDVPTIDAADRELLRFLSLHRATTAAQIPTLLGLSESRATARLRRLEQMQLLRRQRIFHGRPSTVTITAPGRRVIGSRLPQPRISLTEYRHDVGVGWLWLAARRGAFGPLREIVSELELRAAARPANGIDQHRPDLMLTTAAGKQVAVELELTLKDRARLDRIMLGFAGDPSLNAVLYLVPNARVGRGIEDAARRSGISGLVHVQPLAPDAIHGAPEVGAVPLRTPAVSAARATSRHGAGR
jgi:DNA-binding MarR family transcriptional regulator